MMIRPQAAAGRIGQVFGFLLGLLLLGRGVRGYDSWKDRYDGKGLDFRGYDFAYCSSHRTWGTHRAMATIHQWGGRLASIGDKETAEMLGGKIHTGYVYNGFDLYNEKWIRPGLDSTKRAGYLNMKNDQYECCSFWRRCDTQWFPCNHEDCKDDPESARMCGYALLQHTDQQVQANDGHALPAMYERDLKKMKVDIEGLDETVYVLPDRSNDSKGWLTDVCNNHDAYDAYNSDDETWKMYGNQYFYMKFESTTTSLPDEKGKVKSELIVKYKSRTDETDSTVCIGNVCETIAKGGSKEGTVTLDFTNDLGRTLMFRDFSKDASKVGAEIGMSIKYSCPDDATLMIRDGSPLCECNPGILSESGNKIALATELCNRPTGLKLTAAATWMSVRVMNVEGLKDARYFMIEAYMRGSATSRSAVYPGHQEKIYSSDPVYRFSNLDTGKRYSVTLIPYDDNDKELTTDQDLSGTVVTHCACSDQEFSAEDDITGAPEGFLVKQADGYISFEFQAASRCEDAYAFTREEGTMDAPDASTRLKTAFTANYYYSPRTRCDMNPISTGKQATDELAFSKLGVYSIYTYCVRAVSPTYMHHPYDDTKPMITSSNTKCKEHRVKWEASVKGKVTLEPSAGSLPVEGVLIAWELRNITDSNEPQVLLSDTLETGGGGNFQIIINEELQLDNAVEYPIHIKFSKDTYSGNTTIKHTFMCDSGTQNCTTDGTIVYLKHLDFDEPLVAYDTTSVLFSGTVVIFNTGCPIAGADVCLVDHGSTSGVSGSSENGVCVTTNAFGEYQVPATIGRRVSVDINYNDHKFEAVDADKIPFYEAGILIEADGLYLNNDFKDVSTAHLYVEVAGGLCNRLLGTSFLEISVSGGCKWTSEVSQSAWRFVHLVPAQLLDVRVTDVKDESGRRVNAVQTYFTNKVNTIDLRELMDQEENNSTSQTASQVTSTSQSMSKEESETLANEEAKEEDLEEGIRQTRFQYDGTLEVNLFLSSDKVGDCDVDDYIKDNQHAGCDSLHVIQSAAAVVVRTSLIYNILDGVTCDIVDEDLPVRLISSLGPDGDEKKKWTEYETLSEDLKKSLDLCNEDSNGCLTPISHDYNNVTEVKSNAHIKYSLLSGPPSINGQYYRTLEFLIGPEGNRIGNHRGCVVIEGDFSVREAASVPLPSHNPILVIRDPPGGLSTATYANVRTSLKATISGQSTFVGFAANVGVSLGIENKVDLCAGGGFGVVVFTCPEEPVNVEASAGVSFDFSKDFLSSFSEMTQSGAVTTTWTYSTSDDPSTAGRMSDTFLVPNLNVKFREVATISWDADTCSASSESSWKFDLESQSNKPTISFVTVYDLENSILPDFESLIGSINETTATEQKIKEKKTLQNGYDAWISNLAAYNATNEKAKKGTLAPEGDMTSNDPFMVYDYFKRTQMRVKPDNPVSSLIPFDLAATATSVTGGANGTTDALLQTNQIEFSGGGGLVEFSMHAEQTTDYLTKIGSPTKNSGGSFTIARDADTEFEIFGVGVEAEIGGDIHYNHEQEYKQETGTDSSTEVSFVLGDGEQPDKFVVAVSMDPVYNTFIFTTVSGVSSCPAEEGTDKAADPKIKVNAPTKPVLPTDPMVFNIELTNAGALAYRFELFMDNGPNQGMLTALVNGFSLAEPQHYETINSRQTIYSTLSVLRGPNLFEYPALKIGMRLQGCNTDPWYSTTTTELVYNQIGEGGDKQIVFAKPCQAIHWAGDLRDNRGFEINTESEKEIAVTVFNPNYMQFSLEDAVTSERLESVLLKYREVGDLRWSLAKTMLKGEDTPIDIDFANSTLAEEDNYGYTTVSWSYSDSQVVDGNYELMVETQCTPIESAPQSFNYFSDDVLYGVIDRKVPKQHGMPTSGPVWPGNDMVFSFSESIRCESYKIEVTVEGIKDGTTGSAAVFDRDNLDTFCEKRLIGFAFDASKVDYSKLMGKKVQIKLTNIFDQSGNPGADISHEITMANINLDSASASFMFLVKNVSCSNPPTSEAESAIASQVEKQLGVTLSANRLVVSGLLCDQESGEMQAKVTIASSSSTGDSSNRLLRKLDTQELVVASYSDSLTLAHALLRRLYSEEEAPKPAPDKSYGKRALADLAPTVDCRITKLVITPDNWEDVVAQPDGDSGGDSRGAEDEKEFDSTAKQLRAVLHEELMNQQLAMEELKLAHNDDRRMLMFVACACAVCVLTMVRLLSHVTTQHH